MSRTALLAVVLAAACASGRGRVVQVGQLVDDAEVLAGAPVVVSGRAADVRYLPPLNGTLSGITFRLLDGTGAVQVVHEGTLDVHTGNFLQVRGHLARAAPGWHLVAERIWIVPAVRPP